MIKESTSVAIITGGAQGIGYAIANRIGYLGSTVYIWDIDQVSCDLAVKKLQEKGIEAYGNAIDITNERAIEEAFDKIIKTGSQIQMVVNSAGILGPYRIKTHLTTLDDFKNTCNVNLFGSFIVTKQALKAMQPFGYGRILLIASIAGKEGDAGRSAYSSSKAAVIGFTKSVGKEYAGSGITVNAIAPATVMTPMVEGIAPEQVKNVINRIPMKRCGSLDEIASLASWILSPEASFNTGFTFDFTGGRAVY